MRLEAKQRLQSFEILPRWVTPSVNLIRSRGDRLNKKGLLEFVHGASNNPDLTVAYRKQPDELEFYVFVKGACQGNVLFAFDQGKKLSQAAKLPVGLAAVPHTVLSETVRGLGLVSFMYRHVLDRNITLITDGHTEMAARVWQKVATGSRYNLYYVKDGSVSTEDTPDSFKVLTRKKL